MASIQIGTSFGALSIQGFEDDDLCKRVLEIQEGIKTGKHGTWLSLAPKPPDAELENEAEGASLVWAPFTSPMKFTFDADELPEVLLDEDDDSPSPEPADG
ncbi:MAG: hypothetical protein ACTHNS_06170 [Marmoricola sp.]